MNTKIKQKAQELYPPTTNASEYVAFLKGAKEMREVVRLGLAEIMEQCTIDELTEICLATDKMQEVLRKYKNIVNNDN